MPAMVSETNRPIHPRLPRAAPAGHADRIKILEKIAPKYPRTIFGASAYATRLPAEDLGHDFRGSSRVDAVFAKPRRNHLLLRCRLPFGKEFNPSRCELSK
jgi:hypothetical protein